MILYSACLAMEAVVHSYLDLCVEDEVELTVHSQGVATSLCVVLTAATKITTCGHPKIACGDVTMHTAIKTTINPVILADILVVYLVIW